MDPNNIAARIVEDATAEDGSTFEQLAADFWEDTGIIAPGVDIPDPLTDRWGDDERWRRWRRWQADRKAGRPTKDNGAAALGRKGGLKGGKARAEALSPERRKEIARTAARARWDKE